MRAEFHRSIPRLRQMALYCNRRYDVYLHGTLHGLRSMREFWWEMGRLLWGRYRAAVRVLQPYSSKAGVLTEELNRRRG
jgi:hypothetical protein